MKLIAWVITKIKYANAQAMQRHFPSLTWCRFKKVVDTYGTNRAGFSIAAGLLVDLCQQPVVLSAHTGPNCAEGGKGEVTHGPGIANTPPLQPSPGFHHTA